MTKVIKVNKKLGLAEIDGGLTNSQTSQDLLMLASPKYLYLPAALQRKRGLNTHGSISPLLYIYSLVPNKRVVRINVYNGIIGKKD